MNGSPGPQDEGAYDYIMSEHFQLSGLYWALTCLALLGAQEQLDNEAISTRVMRCQKPSGGFGASERSAANILSTLSAV